jgi:hypothetical protein
MLLREERRKRHVARCEEERDIEARNKTAVKARDPLRILSA